MGIYYSPEDFDAELIGDVDRGGGYDFDMIAVYKRKSDGAIFFGEDAGCSCFSPFSDATWETLTHVRNASWFAGQARKWLRDEYHTPSASEREAIERLIRKVRKELA